MALTEPNRTVHLGESSRIVHWQGLGETIALAAAEEGAAALIICGRSEENGRKVRSRGCCCCAQRSRGCAWSLFVMASVSCLIMHIGSLVSTCSVARFLQTLLDACTPAGSSCHRGEGREGVVR